MCSIQFLNMVPKVFSQSFLLFTMISKFSDVWKERMGKDGECFVEWPKLITFSCNGPKRKSMIIMKKIEICLCLITVGFEIESWKLHGKINGIVNEFCSAMFDHSCCAIYSMYEMWPRFRCFYLVSRLHNKPIRS
jgi:hypothetical protein